MKAQRIVRPMQQIAATVPPPAAAAEAQRVVATTGEVGRELRVGDRLRGCRATATVVAIDGDRVDLAIERSPGASPRRLRSAVLSRRGLERGEYGWRRITTA